MPTLIKWTLCLTGLVFWFSVQAQHLPRCGTPYFSPETEQFPDMTGGIAQTRSIVFVPVVVHIVWNGDEQNISDEVIFSQIDVLNEDYSAANADLDEVPERFRDRIGNPAIQFCLASLDPSGNPSNGIVRRQTDVSFVGSTQHSDGRRNIKHQSLGGSDAWDVTSYLNIWVGDRDDFLGDATFPIGEDNPADEEGVVIKYTAFGKTDEPGNLFSRGRTLTHEVGHYFNLQHLFGTDIGCGTDGDHVDDTPAQSGPYFGCDRADNLQSCGSFDMASNFMNFRDDVCMHYFTKGQAGRMMDALFTFRFDLINSRICNTEPVIPPDPLRIAFVSSRKNGLLVRLRPLAGMQYQLQLFNTSGQRLWTSNQNDTDTYDVSGLSSGVYILSLYFEGRIFGRKIFVP